MSKQLNGVQMLQQMLTGATAPTTQVYQQTDVVLSVDQFQQLFNASVKRRRMKNCVEMILPIEAANDPVIKTVISAKQASNRVIVLPVTDDPMLIPIFGRGLQVAQMTEYNVKSIVLKDGKAVTEEKMVGYLWKLVFFLNVEE